MFAPLIPLVYNVTPIQNIYDGGLHLHLGGFQAPPLVLCARARSRDRGKGLVTLAEFLKSLSPWVQFPVALFRWVTHFIRPWARTLEKTKFESMIS